MERLTWLIHPDGTPVYRCEQVESLRGSCREPNIRAPPVAHRFHRTRRSPRSTPSSANFRQLPAVLDSFAGVAWSGRRSLVRDVAGGCCNELGEPPLGRAHQLAGPPCACAMCAGQAWRPGRADRARLSGWWASAATWPRALSCEWPRRSASRWTAGSNSPTPSCCGTRGLTLCGRVWLLSTCGTFTSGPVGLLAPSCWRCCEGVCQVRHTLTFTLC